MNITNNLIAPGEIRSTSLISMKAVLGIVAIILPLMIATALTHAYLSYAEQASTLEVLEGTWKLKEGDLKRTRELTAELGVANTTLAEIDGWRTSRILWHESLQGLLHQVPATVQLKVLLARQSLNIGEKDVIARQFRININGRCQGPNADATVEAMRRTLQQEPPFGPLINTAVISGFREDTEAGAGEQDRAFQIDIDYKPRRFREVAAK